MDSTQSLTLNEEAFKQIPDHKKPLYVFEWLRYLDKGLVAAQKVGLYKKKFFLISFFDLKQFDETKIHWLTVGHKSMPKEAGGAIDNTNSRITRSTNT